jgi:hypothetical protein
MGTGARGLGLGVQGFSIADFGFRPCGILLCRSRLSRREFHWAGIADFNISRTLFDNLKIDVYIGHINNMYIGDGYEKNNCID